MQCPEKTWFDGFVVGDVATHDVREFEAHLDDCARCLEAVANAAGTALSSPQTFAPEEEREPASSPRESTWFQLIAAVARSSDISSDDETAGHPQPEAFGPYEVQHQIGRGAMGVVYRVAHRDTGAKAALKTARRANGAALDAIRHEIAFLNRVQCSGIVRLIDDGIAGAAPWYAMELLECDTLSGFNERNWAKAFMPQRSSSSTARRSSASPERVAAAGGRLDAVLSLYARLCVPLSAVHRAGVVHCDLKPANIFVRTTGEPVIVDFGLLARAGGSIGRETLELGGLRGSLPYLAPEVIRGRIPDARVDLYGLGCMLYESITRRPPFQAATASALLRAHVHDDPVPASQLVDDLPPALDRLLAQLLEKRPDQRVGTADQVRGVLEGILAIPVSAPASYVPPYLFRPRMVGRDAIVSEIEALAADAEIGEGRVLLVGGESGIGKTFLASEIASQFVRRGFEVIAGECTAVDPAPTSTQAVPGAALEPFRPLLRRAVDTCETADDAAQLFGGHQGLCVLAQYEPALARFVQEGTDDPGSLPPMAARERVIEAMREVVGRFASRRPLLILLDDVQWGDDLSLAVLSDLSTRSDRLERVLVVALYRSEETPPALSELQALGHVVARSLTRLDDQSLMHMAEDMLAQGPSSSTSAAWMRRLVAGAEGNPFFVAEFLRSLASGGALEQTSTGWRVNDLSGGTLLDALALPRSLHDLLERRLGRLSAGARTALEAATLLGREFRPAVLERVCLGSDGALPGWLEEMVQRQLVEATRDEQLRFIHDKIREIAYARIEPTRRRDLHLLTGEALEVERVGAPPGHYDAEIAYHLRKGGAAARSIEYFARGAELALQRSANRDSVHLFREAQAVAAESGIPIAAERRAHWARRIGDALQGLGDLAASKEHLLEALQLLGEPMPTSASGLGIAVAEQMARQIVRRASPRRPRALATSQDRHVELARTYDRLTQIYYYRGEYGPLFYANLATLDFAERVPPSPSRAVGFANVAATAGLIPLRGVAKLYFALSRDAVRDAPDPEVESYYHVLHGHYLSGIGEWRSATSAADRIMQLAEGLGFRRRWEEGAGLRSSIEFGRDFERSLAWSERMHQSALRRSDRQTTCWGHLRRAEICLERGDLEAAEPDLELAERTADEVGLPEQIRALALRAFARAARGSIEESALFANRASGKVAQTQAMHLYCVDAYAKLAHVLLGIAAHDGRRRGSRHDAARKACETLARAARAFPVAVPAYCLYEGARRSLLGARRSATSLWKFGHERAKALDLPLYEARLLVALVYHRALPAMPHARRVADLLERLGARTTAADGPFGNHQPQV